MLKGFPQFQFTSHDLIMAAAVSTGVLIALLLVRALLGRQLRRLSERSGALHLLGYPLQLLQATRWPFLLGLALLIGLSPLDFTPGQEKWLHYAWILVLLTQVALWGNRIISVSVGRSFEQQRTTNPAAATHLGLVAMVARIILWTVATLILLDNFGINISALVASLGIGGIAVALAAQNILGDLFASVSIALDKPFVLGDFIIFDDYMGAVEHVGMKSTRLRSLGGEQIVIANSELLKNRIRNYKRMQERRIVFGFGIAYETEVATVEAIPAQVRAIVEAHTTAVRFDRAHFKGYGDSALQFEVVYYVLSADFNIYMDIQQKINLDLLRAMREQGVAFAYPTRTVHIVAPDSDEARQPPPERGRSGMHI